MKRKELLAATAGLPFALALPRSAPARASGGTPVALVTADRESHVVALDPDTGTVKARIRTAPGPRSIESAFLTWAVVAHTASGRLSILDAHALRVRMIVGGFREPRYTAVHPVRFPSQGDPAARPIAYVTDSGRHEVVTLDVVRGKVIWRTLVPGPARHATVSPTGAALWTALGSKAERVAVLDLENPLRPRLRRTFAPPFLAHDVVFTRDGASVWVTSGDRRRIAIYDSDGSRPVAVLDADAPPQHIAFRGARAYVASGDDGTVRFHAADGTVLDEARVPEDSYNVTSFGSSVTTVGAITPSLGRGTLSMLDGRGRVRSIRKVARAAHDACLVVA